MSPFKLFFDTVIGTAASMAEFFVLVIILALLSLFVRFILSCIYKKSAYYEVTHKPIFRVLRDAGALGEFLTYLELRAFEKRGARFLFNVYIPKHAESADEPICPRCGSPLVLRTATRGRNSGGRFWGCSAFPKCRYTKPTDGAVSD